MHIVEHPVIPFSTPIINGVNHNAKIEIHGIPVCGRERGFVIELMTHDGVALQLNARFGQCGDHTLVVNSMECGRWQHEDRHCNPFHEDRHFHVKIKNHGTHFAIHVNGRHVCHFHHRVSPHHIIALGIRGDIRIQKIHFERFHHHNGGGISYGAGGVGYGAGPSVVVYEDGHHHHHHGHHHHHHNGHHGLLDSLFGHHHHNHHC